MKLNISQKFRQHYGLSQQDLANICNKSRSTVMNWEYNDLCPASIRFLLQEILEQGLSTESMIFKLKQVFDKHVDTKSV